MKAGEIFTLTYTWWKTGQPATLKATGLGEALKAFELADKAFQSKKSADNYVALTKALDKVNEARLKAIGMCSDKVHAETKAALQKADVIDDRRNLYKQIMIKLLEPKVKAVEDMIPGERQAAQTAETGAAYLRGKIDAAIASKNKPDIEKYGKEIGRRETNIRQALGAMVSDAVEAAAMKVKGPGLEALTKRLAAARKASLSVHRPKLKKIVELADEYRNYVKDED